MVPATGGTPRQLTNGDWDHNGVEFTPDGKQILFTSLRVPDAEYEWRESEIYSVNVDTGAITQLTTPQGSRQQPEGLARRQAASPTPASTRRATPGPTASST